MSNSKREDTVTSPHKRETSTDVDPDLYADLACFIDNEQYEQALVRCCRILQASPYEWIVIKTQCFCLFQLQRWNMANHAIDTAASLLKGLSSECYIARIYEKEGQPQKCSDNEIQDPPLDYLLFEKLYSYYRLNKSVHALKMMESLKLFIPTETLNQLDHLLAQINYRLENYAISHTIYTRLLAEDPHDTDALTNAVACAISGDLIESSYDTTNDENTYELAFNLACLFLEKVDYEKAESYLDSAQSLCRKEMLEEKVTEEAIQSNPAMSSILVQQSALKQIKREELEEVKQFYKDFLCKSVDHLKKMDVTVLAVARNNLFQLEPNSGSLADALKRINLISPESLKYKLTKRQAATIAYNRCFNLQSTGKLSDFKKEVLFASGHYPMNEPIQLLTASYWFKAGNFSKCQAILQRILNRNPKNRSVLIASIILHIKTNRFVRILDLLDRLEDNDVLTTLPDVAHLYAGICVRSGNVQRGVEKINDWISKMEMKGSSSAYRHSMVEMLLVLAELNEKDREYTRRTYEKILNLEKGDFRIQLRLAQLSLLSNDSETAESYARNLGHLLPHQELVLLDADALENTHDVSSLKTRKKNKDTELANSEDQKKRKKRKRKPLLPKSYNPALPIPFLDPERWLPRHQKTKKIRKRSAARGPQGTVGQDSSRNTGPSTKHAEAAVDKTIRQKTQNRKKKF